MNPSHFESTMNFVRALQDSLAGYSSVLSDPNLLGLLRYVVGITTLIFSTIAFYLKLREKKNQQQAQLAFALTSWDARTRLPLFPLPSRHAPFPFTPSALVKRFPSSKGWFTITELRIWNSGGRALWGTFTNPSMDVHVSVSNDVGPYALRGCMSNDKDIRFHLGRTIHSSTGQQRIPLRFDILRPGKGVLVQIWHNAPDDMKLRVNAVASELQDAVLGTHHPINPGVFRFMNATTLWLVLPSAMLTTHTLIAHNAYLALISGIFTWFLIVSAYLAWRLQPRSPDDLSFRSGGAKVIFYNGPG